MTIALIIIIIVLLVLLISTKLGLTAYVAWMEEKGYQQPTDKDMQRLITWCVEHYIKDFLRKS